MDTINREHVLGGQTRDHARLLKVRLHRLSPWISVALLRGKEGRRFLLVEEGLLTRARVGIQDSIGGARVHGLGHVRTEERHHVCVSRRSVNHLHGTSRLLWVHKGLHRVHAATLHALLLLLSRICLIGKGVTKSRKAHKKNHVHLCV